MVASRNSLLVCSLSLFSATAFGQSAVLSGTVIDARTERPLSGAVVLLDDSAQPAATDSNGRFTLQVAPGKHSVTVSLVGYALDHRVLEVGTNDAVSLTIRLSEGTGPYEERITVSGKQGGTDREVPGESTLHGREIQALRGVTLDDPFRAIQSLPSAVATDDFYSEFAVRGSPFREVGLIVDGVPSRYVMHSVHGVTDGGSIAMINTDAVADVSLSPGSYAQHYGRRIGAQVDLSLREGARDRVRARAGLSGTSATVLAEGPLQGDRGSWLLSARRSYLDLLLKRIDDENSLAFGFTDAEFKTVFDVSPQHQIQALAILGASSFSENPEQLGTNDEATVDGRSWLTSLAWRFTPSTRFLWTHRIFATGRTYDNRNRQGAQLDDSTSAELGWRSDATLVLREGALLELGADAVRSSAAHARWRSLNDQPDLTLLNRYREAAVAASAYGQLSLRPTSRITISPGVRLDNWKLTGAVGASPWTTMSMRLASRTTFRAGAGLYRQFPELEQVFGIRGGGTQLRPETATHIDLGIKQQMGPAIDLQVTLFARREQDTLWTPGAEPRRLADGSLLMGRGDAPWTNALKGDARGVEIIVRRDAAAGLTGWAGYAYGRSLYKDVLGGQQFWADFDQRHALSLFGHYRLTGRTTLSAKFRYGSNYPLVGYIREQPFSPTAPPLFGGEQPLFFGLGEERNTLRLPAYARLDVRADRTFSWSGRRITLFVELANALDRRNLRNVPYGVDRLGRVVGPTDALLPLLPSAGFAIEF